MLVEGGFSMKFVYPAVFYPGETGAFAIEFPDLPGCVSGGDDMAEAIEMAQDAACGWIADSLQRGQPVPPPSRHEAVQPDPDEPGGFVNLIVLDMDEFAAKYGARSVRKNLTIPAYLATAADKRNINYSQVLQNALMETLELRSLS
jgi:predicted RNase H-like HicB family nuclease